MRYTAAAPRPETPAYKQVQDPIWQFMDTAPKDRPILGWCPDMVAPTLPKVQAISICWWEPKLNGGCWWGDSDYRLYPTLWQPLPEPPP